MKISAQAPEGYDAQRAPHIVILEAENDQDIAVLKAVVADLLKGHKSPILLPQ